VLASRLSARIEPTVIYPPGALVELRSVRKIFGAGKKQLVAVNDVSLSIRPNETLGLAGRSGAGKTTIGRLILNLEKPTGGEIYFNGQRIDLLPSGERRTMAAKMQMVFQNPVASMNPRLTAASIIERPLKAFGLGDAAERRDRIEELLTLVGLSPRHAQYYPHEFSGGQCQRLGIARALASHPKFIFLDEPVSALDVSIQAQILNLLKDLKERFALTYLFVANNINVTKFISDRIGVMSDGRLVEIGLTDALFANPSAIETKKLISAYLNV
jgi:ABC-type oligopeptide transport system ATPase subunit